MAGFRFIHAADLHLGSPFQGLAMKDAAVADAFAAASRNAFTRLVALAIERKVDFVVIAGDVYDGDWKDTKIGLFFNREVAYLDRAGIPVYLIKGNHDAVSEISKTIGLPKNVHEFSADTPQTLIIDHLRVALHGQSFLNRAETANLVPGYPAALPGHFNIGLLHTSLTGREPHANYAPCSVMDLKAKGYDYWALGHVHDYELVSDDPPVIFPGNLQGRSVRECGEKGAVLVTVEDGRVLHERLIVDEARFFVETVRLEKGDGEADLIAAAETALQPLADRLGERHGAVRLRVEGETAEADRLTARRRELSDEIQAACHRVHPDLFLEKLELRLTSPALPVAAGGDAGLDLAQLMQFLENDPELDLSVETLLRECRIPSAFLGELDGEAARATLIAEAKALLAGLAGGEGRG